MQERTPRPPCPHCEFGHGRWIELAYLLTGEASFICVGCGHFWTAPLFAEVLEPGNLLPFTPASIRKHV